MPKMTVTPFVQTDI